MGVSLNIRKLREDAGMTQADLAERLGVARSTVTQWENGWSAPRMGMVQRLAGVFGTSTTTIVAETEPTCVDAEAAALLSLMQSMSAEGKQALLATARALAVQFPGGVQDAD